MQDLTFDQLPSAVSQLNLKLERIECLILKQAQVKESEPHDQLFTIQEAANFLKLAVPTIYGMVSRKEIPFMKQSKRLYFSRLELLNYLKGGRKKTIPEIQNSVSQFLGQRRKQS